MADVLADNVTHVVADAVADNVALIVADAVADVVANALTDAIFEVASMVMFACVPGPVLDCSFLIALKTLNP